MHFLFIVMFLFNCSPDGDNASHRAILSPDRLNIESQPTHEYEIERLDYLLFRRSYSYSEEIYENEKLQSELDNRNPERINGQNEANTNYDSGFNKLGLLDEEGNLKLKVWEKISERSPEKINIGEQEYLLNIASDNGEGYDIEIRTKHKVLVAKNNFKFGDLPEVSFCVYDIDNDGQDEIISMFQWYIINGDNYDFNVYEIR